MLLMRRTFFYTCLSRTCKLAFLYILASLVLSKTQLVVPAPRSSKVVELYQYLSRNSLGSCHDGLYNGAEFCRLQRCLQSSIHSAVISLDGASCSSSEVVTRAAEVFRASHVDVSFILAVQNLPLMTAQVILELFVTSAEVQTSEFVIVDNGSTADMTILYKQVEFLKAHFGTQFKMIHHTEALGFSKANNLAVRHSRGKFIAFINSDAFVSPGWLKPLVFSFHQDDIVAAGPLFLTDSLEISEAGGVVFSDASAANFGRRTKINDAIRFARPVDYISAACVLISRPHFDLVGGLDENYGPGYYEDTDLFKHLDTLGFKIMYQPASVILHDEGHTLGSNSPLKQRLMEENRERFRNKWGKDLQSHCDPGTDAYTAATRKLFPKILWIDDIVPEIDHDSGSMRTFNILRILLHMGHGVEFQAITPREGMQKYMAALRALGVNVRQPSETIAGLTDDRCAFDAILVARRYVFSRVKQMLREGACQNLPVVFDTVDVHFLREARDILSRNGSSTSVLNVLQAIEGDAALSHVKDNRDEELHYMMLSDVVIVVSQVEKAVLRTLLPTNVRVELVSNIHPVHEVSDFLPCAHRSDALFVGNMNHQPNLQAIEWWFESVVPNLKYRVMLHIVGSNDVTQLKEFLQGQNPLNYRLHHSIQMQNLKICIQR